MKTIQEVMTREGILKLTSWNGVHIEDIKGHIDMALHSLELMDGGEIGYCVSGDLMVVVHQCTDHIDAYITRVEQAGEIKQ